MNSRTVARDSTELLTASGDSRPFRAEKWWPRPTLRIGPDSQPKSENPAHRLSTESVVSTRSLRRTFDVDTKGRRPSFTQTPCGRPLRRHLPHRLPHTSIAEFADPVPVLANSPTTTRQRMVNRPNQLADFFNGREPPPDFSFAIRVVYVLLVGIGVHGRQTVTEFVDLFIPTRWSDVMYFEARLRAAVDTLGPPRERIPCRNQFHSGVQMLAWSRLFVHSASIGCVGYHSPISARHPPAGISFDALIWVWSHVRPLMSSKSELGSCSNPNA
jgi:hypothetical protein